MEKKFLPARLCEGKYWYIVYYQINPSTGQRERFREKHDLNRIRSTQERRKRSNQLIREINDALPNGYPFAKDEIIYNTMNIVDAIDFAVKIKCNTPKERTKEMFTLIQRAFVGYLKKTKLDKISVQDFNRFKAQGFLDYLLQERKIAPRTYNNYMEQIRSVFGLLVSREIIGTNPFAKFPKAKEVEKDVVTFDPFEIPVILQYIHDHDITLFRIILLEYYGFLRPAEIRELRFKYFDLQKGTITLPGGDSKNNRRRIITIPDTVLPYFLMDDFTRHPVNYLVFGKNLRPHPSVKCGKHAMLRLHQKFIKQMHDGKLIKSIDGITLYTWKRTGITDHSEYLDLIDLMKQAGHRDTRTTLLYYNWNRPNTAIKKLPTKPI